MVKPNEQFLKGTIERVGEDVAKTYSHWHDLHSTELSYKWLEENNYPIEYVLEPRYQNQLHIYLVEQFINWYKEWVKED